MFGDTILTFIFYIFYIFMVMVSYNTNHRQINWFFVISLSLILGLRGCGIDTLGYREIFRFYYNIDAGLFNPLYYNPYFNPLYDIDFHIEWFYLVLIKIIKLFSSSSVWLFLIADFISACALDNFIRRFSRREKVFVIFFFFTTLLFVHMFNIMRQVLSFLLFLNIIDFLKDRKWKPYFACVIFLYFFFHHSAILLIVLYFFAHKDVLKSKLFQVGLYTIVVIFSVVFINQLMIIMDGLFMLVGGDFSKAQYLNSETQVLDMRSSALTIIFYFFVMLYMIIHSDSFKKAYGTMGVIMYNIAYMGMLVVNVAYNRGVERVNVYFFSIVFIVLGLMTYQSLYGYFKKTPLMTLYTFGLFILYLAWFANAVLQGAAGCAPYFLNPEI